MRDYSYKTFDAEGNQIGGGDFYVALTEHAVFNYPEGMYGCRFFRIEYGGINEYEVAEGGIWLPPDASRDLVEQYLRDMWKNWEGREE